MSTRPNIDQTNGRHDVGAARVWQSLLGWPTFIRKIEAAFAAPLAALFVMMAPVPVTAETIVVGTGNPAIDVPAVQAAVEYGGLVVLKGTFNFDRPPIEDRSVLVTKPVVVSGTVDEDGQMTAIMGGLRPFAINAPDANVTIQSLRFVRPELFAIDIFAVSGLRILKCKVERVTPSFVPVFGVIAGGFSMFLSDRTKVSGNLSYLDNELDIGGEETIRTYGILISQAGSPNREVEVCIAGNLIKNTTGHAVDVRNIIGRAQIAGNRIRTGAIGAQRVALADTFVDGIRCVGSGKYLVTHNSIECAFENAAGIRLQGNSASVPIVEATLEGNEIIMTLAETVEPGNQSAGIDLRRASRKNAVLHNRLLGRARAALSLVSDPTQTPGVFLTPSDNVFVGNNYSNFLASLADVFVSARVTDTVIVGGKGSIDDHGVGTTIKGGYRILFGDHYHSQGGVGEQVSDAERF